MNRSRVTGDLASQGNIFVDIANDRVGIGSTIPTQKLDVVGTVKATAFSGDGSGLSGVTSVGGDTGADFNDSVKVRFGTGNDLELYHDGSHSYIHDGGTGNLKVRSNNFRVSNADESKISATFVPSGAVELYYNNTKRLETLSTGAAVTGELDVSGTIDMNTDTGRLKIGAGDDLSLWHDGSNSYIANTSGQLRIWAKTDGYAITCTADGPVNLYHNNSVRLGTTSGGIDVTGTVTADNQIVLNSGDSTPARIDLYCEVSNAHYTRLQAPAHSTYSGNVTVTIPNTSGNLAVLANAANNRVVTATGTHGMTGETALTFYQSGNDSILTIEGTNSAGHAQLTLKTGGTTDHCSINFGDSDDHDAGEIRYTNSSDSLNFDTAGVHRMTLDSSGRLLIGTTTVGQATADDLTIATTSNTGITIRSGTGNDGNIYFSDGTSGSDEFRGYIQYGHSNNSMVFGTNASERIRIDSSGRILIGLSSDSRTTTMILSGNSSTGATGQAILNMDIGTSSISDGTSIGVIRFGATGDRRGADIKAEGAGTWSAGSSHPIDLIFSTNPSGSASTPPERMRIDSDGNMSLGKGSAASTNYGRQIQIHSTSTSGAALHLTNSNSGSTNNDGFHLVQQTHIYHWLREDAHQIFGTNGTEKMRLTSSGQLLIGTTSTSGVSSGSDDLIIGSIGDSTVRGITLATTSSAAIRWADAGDNAMGRIQYSNSTDYMTIHTSNAIRLTIADNGRIKIGSGEPKAQLDIKQVGNSWEDSLLIQHDNANTGWNIHAERTGNGLWFGYNSGTDATLANQNAVQVLHLNGNRTTSLVAYVDSYELTIGGISGGPTLFLRDSGSTGNSRILFGSSAGALDGAIYYKTDSNYLAFYTNGTEHVRINSSGHLNPVSDATRDLGTSSLRWRNVYTTDLQLSNENTGGNEVDGTEGNWTLQEGESDVYMINRKTGKKYKMMLQEVS